MLSRQADRQLAGWDVFEGKGREVTGMHASALDLSGWMDGCVIWIVIVS